MNNPKETLTVSEAYALTRAIDKAVHGLAAEIRDALDALTREATENALAAWARVNGDAMSDVNGWKCELDRKVWDRNGMQGSKRLFADEFTNLRAAMNWANAASEDLPYEHKVWLVQDEGREATDEDINSNADWVYDLISIDDASWIGMVYKQGYKTHG